MVLLLEIKGIQSYNRTIICVFQESKLEEKIKAILKEQVDPVLQEHFGGSSLSKYEDGVAYVRLTGACAQCPSAQETLESVVKDFVMGGCPDVKDVVLDTSVSEDLLEMARKILRGEIKDD
jgi:Fe-S cluster biogenesis protein NfuA